MDEFDVMMVVLRFNWRINAQDLEGLVELDNGVEVLSQIVDVEPDEVETGMRGEATFRRVKEDGSSGIIEYGYKFRPVIG